MKMAVEFCKFNKFGFCKFGNECRKKHFDTICEHNFCENVKSWEKRHPRNCYYFFAYGYCKFGVDCQFKHGKESSKVTHANKEQNLLEKNEALKKEIIEITKKNEELKVHLDELIESQSNQNVLNKQYVDQEISNFKNEFLHVLSGQKMVISSQERKNVELSSEIVELKQENLKLKITRVFACDECDFETTEKHNLIIHRKNDHDNQLENESENEDSDDEYLNRPIYQCDRCAYNCTYPDNVAFHYGEKHNIKMNWEQAEAYLKRWFEFSSKYCCEIEISVSLLLTAM